MKHNACRYVRKSARRSENTGLWCGFVLHRSTTEGFRAPEQGATSLTR